MVKETAIVVVNYPQEYSVEDDRTYSSPDYRSADHRIELSVDMAIGRLAIVDLDY
jgi:hypothetical protein